MSRAASARPLIRGARTGGDREAQRSFAEPQARLNRLSRLYREISPSLPWPPAPIRAATQPIAHRFFAFMGRASLRTAPVSVGTHPRRYSTAPPRPKFSTKYQSLTAL